MTKVRRQKHSCPHRQGTDQDRLQPLKGPAGHKEALRNILGEKFRTSRMSAHRSRAKGLGTVAGGPDRVPLGRCSCLLLFWGPGSQLRHVPYLLQLVQGPGPQPRRPILPAGPGGW